MENEVKDKWQIALDEELVLLKNCQKSKNLESCMQCDKILDCEVRDKYIKVVYESMNKGSGGGFEF
ncbi:MAG: hypothetical protein U9R37_06515 [Campylobacterota bacterium]|nr:hypothetical protein [Campylobacterota bacterium]